jgi:hypothetical protein
MLTPATAEAYLGALALPEPGKYASLTDTGARAAIDFPHAMRGAPQTSGKSAQVNAGSLVSFVEGLNGQDKTDVMNSTLLAQLSANEAFDRFEKPLHWFRVYSDVLRSVGWEMWASRRPLSFRSTPLKAPPFAGPGGA